MYDPVPEYIKPQLFSPADGHWVLSVEGKDDVDDAGRCSATSTGITYDKRNIPEKDIVPWLQEV